VKLMRGLSRGHRNVPRLVYISIESSGFGANVTCMSASTDETCQCYVSDLAKYHKFNILPAFSQCQRRWRLCVDADVTVVKFRRMLPDVFDKELLSQCVSFEIQICSGVDTNMCLSIIQYLSISLLNTLTVCAC
jgi:hypothetical protein